MKKTIIILSLLVWSVAAIAQESSIPVRETVVQMENSDGDSTYEIINMPKDGQNHYWLNVGRLGHGDEVIQIHIDPLHQLYIPLGDNLDEAIEMMTKFRDFCKEEPGTSMEVSACLVSLFPDTDKLETATVTVRKVIFSRKLEFSVQRGEYLRATYVPKSELGSMLTSLKFDKKLNPNK